MLGVRSLTAILVVSVMVGWGEGVEDLLPGDSSLHYSYEKSYGYSDHLHHLHHLHPHHQAPYQAYGHKHKYGHHEAGLGNIPSHPSHLIDNKKIMLQDMPRVTITLQDTILHISMTTQWSIHLLLLLHLTMDTFLILWTMWREKHLDMI